MKECSNCKIEKEFNQFSKDKNKKDGHSYVCKQCQKERMTIYYLTNRDTFKIQSLKNKNKTKAKNRLKMLEHLRTCKCLDCKNDDIRVLEFDHTSNDKHRGGVNQMLQEGYSWESILKEIEKCDVVCANCHKIRTYGRMETCYRNTE